MQDDVFWSETITAFAGVIRDWEQRLNEVNDSALVTGIHPCEPEPGSVMALDNAGMGFYFPAVWNALAQSVDHLAAVVDLIDTRPTLRVFAYPSLFRSALLGSSEAVWLMAPADPKVRGGRARLLSAEELKHHAAFAADYPEDPDGTAADYKQRHKMELEELERLGFKERYQATTVIRAAGEHMERTMPVPPDTARLVVSQWRLMSAQAHGRTWDKRYRAGYVKGEYRGEQRLSGNVGSAETFGEWMSTATGITAAAWALFDDGRRSVI